MTAEAIIGLSVGVVGVAGWALERARGMGRLEGILSAQAKDIAKLESTVSWAVSELNRSREDQGRRIGAVENRVGELEAVDRDRSRGHRIGGE